MTAGPTLHYSHTNVLSFWLLTVVVFAGVCLFWSKILTGSPWSFNPDSATSPTSWQIGRFLLTGVSIFEYPWQILVLALLMAVLAVVPLLTSQLLSFSYSLPLILAVFLPRGFTRLCGQLADKLYRGCLSASAVSFTHNLDSIVYAAAAFVLGHFRRRKRR